MIEDILDQLNIQEETLVELEEELEMEISRVISLKNDINPELIENLEKIEEGLYVEVKMINETKKSILEIMKKFKDKDDNIKDLVMVDRKEFEGQKNQIDKLKKRIEKLADQLIQSHEEIEDMNNKMKLEKKNHESKLKNEFINKMQDKDRALNEKLFELQHREEELLKELEKLRLQEQDGAEDVAKVKIFFDKKIRNIKKSMQEDCDKQKKNIAKKAVLVLNKKKEIIYTTVMRDALVLRKETPEVDNILKSLRLILNLADDVFEPDNFILCSECGEAVHISQPTCPGCNVEINL